MKLRLLVMSILSVAPRRRTGPDPALPQRLHQVVAEIIRERWAPLYVEPGLAGREFFFTDSGDTFVALAGAYPHLDRPQQEAVRKFLAQEWEKNPPYGPQSRDPLDQGPVEHLLGY